MTEQEKWELRIQESCERFMQEWSNLQDDIAAYLAKGFTAIGGSQPDGIIWSAQHVQKFMVNDAGDPANSGAHWQNFNKGRYIP